MTTAEEQVDPSVRWLIDGYEEWVQREGVKVVGDLAVDLMSVETAPWPRVGAKAAFVHVDARGDINGVQLLEIEPRAETEPIRHVYEAITYVLDGRGITTIDLPEGGTRSFEWGRGSLFALPVNARYRHLNASGRDRALLASVSNLPQIMRLFRNEEFVFGNPIDFPERFGEERFFEAHGTFIPTREHRHIWETNLVPDLASFDQVTDDPGRGVGARHINFVLADGSMWAHMAEIPNGQYKKAHRHAEGIHIIQITGEGYSLYWRDGEEPRGVDWTYGLVHAPPENMWHQHFNTGDAPARYLAIDYGSIRYPITNSRQRVVDRRYTQRTKFQIEYEDEDPSIRQLFEAERTRSRARAAHE